MLRVILAAALVVTGAARVIASDTQSLVVFAAADLAFAFKELVPLFEGANGVKVTLSLGSTGNLATQIEHGAPADVFFSADRSFVERLTERGVLIGETRTRYAQGFIVLATPKRAGRKLGRLGDLLDPKIRRVAIANPLHAPYGRAAEEALRSSGVWDTVKPKLVYGENIRQTLQFVQIGAADAGIVALAVANVPEIEWTSIDPSLHAPLDQEAAVVGRSPRPDLGLAFIRFITSPQGRDLMKKYGFRVPGES